MAGSRGLSVFVNIGARLGSSVNSVASSVENRFARMGRRVSLAGAEMSVAMRRFNAASMGIGGLAAGAGLGIAFKSILGDASEYEHQIQMLRNAGNSARDVAGAIAAAHRTMADVPTARLSESLALMRETTLAYGSLGEAAQNLTFNSRMGAMLKLTIGDDFNEAEGFNQLVRALELRGGKLNSCDYQRQATALFKAFEVSGGTVNPENFLGFMQQAGPAARQMSEGFLTRIVPSLVQEFGGQRAGTAFTALYNQLNGRVAIGGKSITAEWTRLGLVPREGTGGNLSRQGWSAGSLRGYGLAMADPLQWMNTVLFPSLRAHGIDTSNSAVMRLQAQKMFGRETGKRLADTFFDPKQLARINQDAKLYDGARSPDAAYADSARNDPKLGMLALHSSMANLGTVLGERVAVPAARALNAIASGITKLATTFDRHPGLVKALGAIGVALAAMVGLSMVGKIFEIAAAGAGVLGTAAKGLASFLPGLNQGLSLTRFAMVAARYGFMEAATSAGALLLPIVLIGAAIGVLIAKWNGIKAFFKGFGEGFQKALSPETRAAMTRFGSAISGTFGAIGRVLSPVVSLFEKLWRALFNKADEKKWQSAGASFGGAVGSMVNSLAGFIDKLAAAIEHVERFWNSIANRGQPAHLEGGAFPTIPGAAKPTHRALGGSMHAGEAYEVAENGPELFIPGRSGGMLPASVLAALAGPRQAGPASATSIHIGAINVTEARDPRATAREVESVMRSMVARARGALHD